MSASASLPATVSDTADPSADSEETEETAEGEAASGDEPSAEGDPASAEGNAPTDVPSDEPTEVLEASDGLKEAVTEQSETAGNLLESLDKWALKVGDFDFSLLDAFLILGVIALVLTGAWIATRLARGGIGRINRLDGSQKVLAEKLSTILIWAIAFFVGIDMLGIDLTALAFFGGAFGLAIGFGLQKTFGNLISGIILLLDRSIKPGDVISVTDQVGNEAVGQIRKIGIRAISVITRDQTEHLIPNENLMINQVVNWSYSSRDVRVKAPVGVSYGSDLELVSELLYRSVDETPRVLKTPKPRVNIMGFGNSSVDFEVRFWIRDPEEGLANIRSDVYMRIWKLFKEHDIEIPFPQQDLHLRSSEQLDALVEMIQSAKST